MATWAQVFADINLAPEIQVSAPPISLDIRTFYALQWVSAEMVDRVGGEDPDLVEAVTRQLRHGLAHEMAQQRYEPVREAVLSREYDFMRNYYTFRLSQQGVPQRFSSPPRIAQDARKARHLMPDTPEPSGGPQRWHSTADQQYSGEPSPRQPDYLDNGDDPTMQPACLGHVMRDIWWFPTLRGNAGWHEATAAASVCFFDCPVFEQCSDFSMALRPGAGVWAGRLWTSHGTIHGVLVRRNLLPGLLPDLEPETEADDP